MTEVELVTELDDPDSLFTKLASEWRSLSRKVP
jgi:hypothetical protein